MQTKGVEGGVGGMREGVSMAEEELCQVLPWHQRQCCRVVAVVWMTKAVAVVCWRMWKLMRHE